VTRELPIGLGSYDAANNFQTGRKNYTENKDLERFFCGFFFCGSFFFSGRFQNNTDQNVYNSEYALNYFT